MKTILGRSGASLLASVLASVLALALLPAGAALAGVTSIAQLPLLNISGTGNVKPNLMLLYDNSGSMTYNFTPDYIDDTSTCRAASKMSGGTMACAVGHPPFNSADFNRQYYDPKVRYTPPVKADGTSYASMTRAATSAWTSVTTDGFGINKRDLTNASTSTTNLVSGFPDLRWCDSNRTNCAYNTATYTYPSDARTYSSSFLGNPYYYTINVAEYCSDANLTNCQSTSVGAAAPSGYPYEAKIRWCDSRSLTNCQAKYVGNFRYPRFSNPNTGVTAAYGTITIGASTSGAAMSIDSVTVSEANGDVVITNGAVAASGGTNSATKRATLATDLAASIIAKTGLANQYVACVRTPTNSSVPACSSYGITLGGDNMLAVIPIDCISAGSAKTSNLCSLVADGTRSGWGIGVSTQRVIVDPTDRPTAIITVSGTGSSSNTASLAAGTSLGSTKLLASNTSLGKGASAATVATAIRAAIKNNTSQTAIVAYAGGDKTTDVCAKYSSTSTTTICLVDTVSLTGGDAVAMGALSNGGTLAFATVKSSVPAAGAYDIIPFATSALGAGAAVFVRTDIVSTRSSYPRASARSDCAGSTCTYDEEMTNFANWYAYYKTRNQMMKTAVGQAFQALTANYNVGIVSLSTAAAEGTMTVPREFSSTNRSSWYASLYAMDGNLSTPIRKALHAIGKMYANQSPYKMAAGSEAVQYPCQQNFTFITTDGYWNGDPAGDVANNDNVESAARFCTRASGCLDTSTQTVASLADVSLYWYNGGSNTAASSLRPELEDFTRTGLVPASSGDNRRLHMNTYALGLGVDGIMNYEANYETPKSGGDFYNLITGVAKGCPWNNNQAYVWPDPVTTDASPSAAYQSRVDDLWHAAINGHGRYFAASDPTQVVQGLSSALSNIEVRVGAAAAAATSTPNISQEDNDIFSSTFTTVKWFGELSDRKIDTATGIVGTGAVWTSSDTVGRKVAASSDTRTIWMLDTAAAGTLKTFKYASMNATEKAWFDNKCGALGQCASLSADNRAIVNDGANIVDWLRGQQQYADDTVMRGYAHTDKVPAGLSAVLPIVMGDIASSKPAYLRDPRKSYTAAGYADFKTANTGRRPSVFVAANDGMLHAFDAKTGEEMWAYAPRITMKKLYLQASTTYGTNHQFTTDGAPEIGDVKIGTTWRSVVVAGLNAGGRGFYALDVTDPANPKGLWELCADSAVCSGVNYDADLGLSFGNPQFGTWKDASGTERSVVFLTSGYNNVPGADNVNGGDGKGYLYVVDAGTGQVLSKTGTGIGSTGTPSGFARITAITANPLTDPLVTYVYGGDNQGKMWRFDFTRPGNPAVLQMGDAGTAQPVTTRPEVTMCAVNNTDGQGTVSAGAGIAVVFGTGRLLDVSDIGVSDTQSVYVLRDKGVGIAAADWRAAARMSRQRLAKVGDDAGSYTISGPSVDLGTQAGWYFDLDQNSGERVNLDPKVVDGTVNVVTNLPTSSSACSVGGTSNLYQLDVCTGKPVLTDDSIGLIAGRALSNTSATVGFIVVQLPNGTRKVVATTANGDTVTTRAPSAKSQGAHKAGWRRVRD
ncbi:PQQ-binding-like beta-propeller repeat protein [Massilia forsythiae]|uniref:PQQ-binding-like beta-propeller repeat protein n=1 Tax=Massilia forsythiae TaxID=2728020 RepID=A0A7Z2ZUC6_9BURK|nr:PilC/PilY family type IV pilus protein [Massilia forsythiae]QJE02155.1 PQQ-binding-like beta-propeller repeat protein [Massilia forsythiae]